MVLAPDGPLLIMAGPGSGKTMVLAARIAYLVIGQQIPPTSILALTFATRATRELRHRLAGLLGRQGEAVGVSTFHALGLRIVRQWSKELGRGPGPPVVYGPREVQAVLREVAETLGVDLERLPLEELRSRVDGLRLHGNHASQQPDVLQPVVDAYEEVLRRRGTVDFPAMLTLPLQLFGEQPRALRLCQDSYRVVLCDEFQDVCACQYALLRSLAARHRHLIVVGDPMQTLYRWRGADIRFLNAFQRDFPEARITRLYQNFRSTQQIVECATILGASLALNQPLWTTNLVGEAIRLYAAADEQAEASFVASEIEQLVAQRIVDRLDEVAILYRTNWQALPFAGALQERGLPYQRTPRSVIECDEVESTPSVSEMSTGEDEEGGELETEGVRLSTVHRAKGGEWSVVFVVGLEEGLLPHARALANQSGENASIDEERRIAYVAVTRARERLYLTYCRTRRWGGRIEVRTPSRFLRGLPFERGTRAA